MSIFDLFRKKPTATKPTPRENTGGSVDSDQVHIKDAMPKLAEQLSAQLAGILRTEEDTWWFLAEQYDYIVDCGEPAKGLLDLCSMKMHEIEHEGRKSENSYVGKPNPGVDLLKKARALFASKFDEDLADMTIAYAFIMFVENNIRMLNPLRIKYATHFHNNCVSQSAFRNADRWGDVLDSLQRN
ncbi:hypothetical protein GRI55_05425 [Erythrobacter citreus]|uniref:Uncharacterized protein n=1 Tax=Qipengyuania citrea TaxID=225971 RepID=A0A6I4U8C8_9SPHN|nr:hypothetical protein [Qipengyuania citrea]MDQ0566864.1 hypothetical protein [Qipengyuania citrea]MXP35210.1 hypothetical protein [Qipengyuania citrea]